MNLSKTIGNRYLKNGGNEDMDIRQEILEKYVSKSLRDYFNDNHMEFADSLLAAIVWNSRANEDDQKDILSRLAESTDDLVLKEQLERRCTIIWEKQLAFMTNIEERAIVYVLELFDEDNDDYFTNGVFTDANSAINVGRRYGVKFKVTKYSVITSMAAANAELNSEEYLNDKLGIMHFSSDGKVFCTISFERVETELCLEDEKKSFELKYVGIRHPFRNGDIVVYTEYGTYGVVDSVQDEKELEAHIERYKSFADFSDEVVIVEFPNEDGQFYHSHVSVWEIEKVNLEWPNDTEPQGANDERAMSDELAKLLLTASALKKGDGLISSFLNAEEEYKEALLSKSPLS